MTTILRGHHLGHMLFCDLSGEEVGPWTYEDTGELFDGAADRACLKCGLMPTEDGHDPCIANLPGVTAACCGHGEGGAYVLFDNGLVIRGKWDHQK